MKRVLFSQTADPPILLPLDGEEVTLLSLEVPECDKHKLFKIDVSFELNFSVRLEPVTLPFLVDLHYQLFDGSGDGRMELTPILKETVCGTAKVNPQVVDFESNTTPNLTIVAEGLVNQNLTLVANLNIVQGKVIFPLVRVRAMSVKIFP
ncbi:hypothetical protein [Chengkuizengella marina]|uniref:Exosporium protein C n=1 Tax=Chengkuizengella marina TaxID=2507566 RepID=A0A6N9PY23_9BACL|nr:hypothetical protein [Chengkuizengella marina]NBI27806.1 hypothetical protein [Chengkuizengella marina]